MTEYFNIIVLTGNLYEWERTLCFKESGINYPRNLLSETMVQWRNSNYIRQHVSQERELMIQSDVGMPNGSINEFHNVINLRTLSHLINSMKMMMNTLKTA